MGILKFFPFFNRGKNRQYPNDRSLVLQCPVQLSRFFSWFFPTFTGIFPTLPGKYLFFSRHMIPTVEPLQKLAEEEERLVNHNLTIPAPSSESDSPPLRRPSSGVDALCAVAPFRPHRPPLPSAPLPYDRHSRHETSIPHHRRSSAAHSAFSSFSRPSDVLTDFFGGREWRGGRGVDHHPHSPPR